MSRLTYAQKRIRAADRILKHDYWLMKHSIRERVGAYAIEFEEHLQERINYFEEIRDRITISL